jgi:hypothetical protein
MSASPPSTVAWKRKASRDFLVGLSCGQSRSLQFRSEAEWSFSNVVRAVAINLVRKRYLRLGAHISHSIARLSPSIVEHRRLSK